MVTILLLLAMFILLLPILGVITALTGQRKPVAVREQHAVLHDFSGVDLNDRLAKITLSPTDSFREVVSPPAFDDPIDAYSRGAQAATRQVGAESQPQLVAPAQTGQKRRLALPGRGGGTVKTATPQPQGQVVEGEGLNPLAGRYSERDAGAPAPAPPGQDLGRGGRLGLPGKVSSEPMPPSLASMGFESERVEPVVQPPPVRPGLPGTVAGGFTVVPDRAARQTPAPNTPVSRPELPGQVAASSGASEAANAQSLDIRAILRGESVPRGLPGTVADFSASTTVPAPKPTFTTGPLPAPVDQGTPLGAVPFDPNVLQVRPPAPPRPEPRRAELVEPLAGFGGGQSGPVIYESTGDERIPATGNVPDFDATRIVEDFDLPDTGFETHVFSTAELVDSEALGITSFESRDATINFPDDEDDEARPAPLIALSPAQEAGVGETLAELVGLPDVSFVKLVGVDGRALFSAGNDVGGTDIDVNIGALFAAAGKEAREQSLGEVGSVALESEQAVLLMTPVTSRSVLAIMLGNPARLGLLRRQVRKPVAALRSLLTE